MTKKHLFQNGLALFVCLFLFAGALFAQNTQTVQVTSNRTWNVPTSLSDGTPITVTSVTFEAWGGGGAGGFTTGGHLTYNFAVSGGGGGGAYGRTVINNPSAGEPFSITIGAGGYNTAQDNDNVFDGGCPWACYKNRTEKNGEMTFVKRGTNVILEAMGGLTCSGEDNPTGAAGGSDAGAGDFHNPGGKGGNAAYECGAATGNRSSGSGGGAAGPNGPGGNATNAVCAANTGWQPGGAAGGGLAGVGGEGTSDHNDIFGGKPVGNPGLNYGGGGAGSKTYESWHSGGAGAPGAVLITYTYTITVVQSVAIADASANVCSGADFDVALNITADGFDLYQAQVADEMVSHYNISIAANVPSYNTLDGKWHLTGSVSNTADETDHLPITVTVTTPDGTASATATVTLNVYPELDGGIIAKDQLVCAGQTIEILKGDGSVVTDGLYYSSVTTAEASGGSGSGSYRWYAVDMIDGSGYELIASANEKNYMPTDNGYFRFKREFVDPVCGSAWATDGNGGSFLIVVTVNPFELYEYGFSEDTICSNENYTHNLEWEGYSPAADWYEYGNWQESTDKGATWVDLASSSSSVTVSLTPDDFSAGDDFWYRFVYPFGDCDPIPGNSIHKIHVKEVPDYTDQFPDLNITLWYGACDTSIAELVPPVLTPTPASITRTDDHGNRLIPGEYELTWSVIADDCNIPVTYTQNVIVNFPKCGTLEEPYVITDRYGYEYNTIRIGCDCWLAENLRTNADNATYYDNDDANEAFGRLYDWNDAVGSFNYEMETKLGTTYIQGVCPMGWAMPTVAQYNKVKEAAGSAEGVKSDDANAWLPDLVGTNTVGFAAMGAGFYSGMEYQRLLGYTDFWTADDNESNSSVAKAMELRPGCDELLPVDKNKADKLSVRCVRVEPLDYVNINIEFDMQDSYGDGWSEGYIRATYGSSTVMLTVTADENICTLPVPRGSDVTLEWLAANMSSEASFTITNEETGEVIAEGSGSSSNVELAQFHVDGVSNPADFQTVDFDFSNVVGSWGYTGLLEVDYGTGKLNLGIASDEDVHSTVAFPAGTHIKLSWIDANVLDYVVALTVKYTGASTYLLEVEQEDLEEGVLLEFDVVKQ